MIEITEIHLLWTLIILVTIFSTLLLWLGDVILSGIKMIMHMMTFKKASDEAFQNQFKTKDE